MAYNKKNYYTKIIEIQELTYKLYHTENMYYTEIYHQHIKPRYHISYRTFNEYLGVPAKRELKKITTKEVAQNKSSLFGKCTHQNTYLKVIHTVVNCETTATFCFDCGLKLTKIKTDCT
jgi:hypothetical protein